MQEGVIFVADLLLLKGGVYAIKQVVEILSDFGRISYLKPYTLKSCLYFGGVAHDLHFRYFYLLLELCTLCESLSLIHI